MRSSFNKIPAALKSRTNLLYLFLVIGFVLLSLFSVTRLYKWYRDVSPTGYFPERCFLYAEFSPEVKDLRLLQEHGIALPMGEGIDLTRRPAFALITPAVSQAVLALPLQDPQIFEAAHALTGKEALETNIGHPVYRAGTAGHGATYFIYDSPSSPGWIFLSKSPDPLLTILEVIDNQSVPLAQSTAFQSAFYSPALGQRTRILRAWCPIREFHEDLFKLIDEAKNLTLSESERQADFSETQVLVTGAALSGLKTFLGKSTDLILTAQIESDETEESKSLLFNLTLSGEYSIEMDDNEISKGEQNPADLCLIPAPPETRLMYSFCYQENTPLGRRFREELGSKIARRLGKEEQWRALRAEETAREEKAEGGLVGEAAYLLKDQNKRILLKTQTMPVSGTAADPKEEPSEYARLFSEWGLRLDEKDASQKERVLIEKDGLQIEILLPRSLPSSERNRLRENFSAALSSASQEQNQDFAGLFIPAETANASVAGIVDPVTILTASLSDKTSEETGPFSFSIFVEENALRLRMRYPLANLARFTEALNSLPAVMPEPVGIGSQGDARK